MRSAARMIEDIFVEIAFAEEREVRYLRNISGSLTEWLDDLFTAITFAEAGEFNTAQNSMCGGSGNRRRPAGCRLPGFCANRA